MLLNLYTNHKQFIEYRPVELQRCSQDRWKNIFLTETSFEN